MKYFIAVYTNECKNYCDKAFFSEIVKLKGEKRIMVVDNTAGTEEYTKDVRSLIPSWYGGEVTVEHLDVEEEPRNTRFLRNVTESVNSLRSRFLAGTDENFVVIESDVIPPKNLLRLFDEVEGQADIIGGIYYRGFHSEEEWDPGNESLLPAHHILSGCTLYTREVIGAIPFRWSMENPGAFPDAWISHDASLKGFRLANYCKIKCNHLSMPNGSRGQDKIR